MPPSISFDAGTSDFNVSHFKFDAVIPAVGQVCVDDCVLPESESVTFWKTLVVNPATFQSNHEHIFGGGNCVTGPKTLIWALAAGKNAARFIDQYLRKGRCAPNAKEALGTIATSLCDLDTDRSFPYPGCSQRMEADILDPNLRIQYFEEVETGVSAAQARLEADRCLLCYRMMMSAV